MADKITREELNNYHKIIEHEQKVMKTILESNEDIYRVLYDNNKVQIQFKNGKQITKDYLDSLSNLIEFKDYNISSVTVKMSFFKLSYEEELLQIELTL